MDTAKKYLDALRSASKSASKWVSETEKKIADAVVRQFWQYTADLLHITAWVATHSRRYYKHAVEKLHSWFTSKPFHRRQLRIGAVGTPHPAPENGSTLLNPKNGLTVLHSEKGLTLLHPEKGLTVLHPAQTYAETLPTVAKNISPIVVAIIFVLVCFLLWSCINFIATKIDSSLELPKTIAPTPQRTLYAGRSAPITQSIEDHWPTYSHQSSSQPPRCYWHVSLLGPHPLDLATAALSASSRLSTFAASVATSTGRFRAAQKQNLNAALAELLAIRARMRAFAGEHGMRVRSNEMLVDAACVICHAEITDTLFIPCRHMVVCGACSDQLGVMNNDSSAVGTAKCPVCGMPVDRTIKVFRE